MPEIELVRLFLAKADFANAHGYPKMMETRITNWVEDGRTRLDTPSF